MANHLFRLLLIWLSQQISVKFKPKYHFYAKNQFVTSLIKWHPLCLQFNVIISLISAPFKDASTFIIAATGMPMLFSRAVPIRSPVHVIKGQCNNESREAILAATCSISGFRWGNGKYHLNGLMHERHNSSAVALELCLSCINTSILSQIC